MDWDHPIGWARGAAIVNAGGWHHAGFGRLEGGRWHHLTASYDGRRLRTYLDGIPVAANDAPSGHVSAQDFRILSPYKGKIDELMIWRRALPEKEVQQLYRLQGESSVTARVETPVVSGPSADLEQLLISQRWRRYDSRLKEWRIFTFLNDHSTCAHNFKSGMTEWRIDGAKLFINDKHSFTFFRDGEAPLQGVGDASHLKFYPLQSGRVGQLYGSQNEDTNVALTETHDQGTVEISYQGPIETRPLRKGLLYLSNRDYSIEVVPKELDSLKITVLPGGLAGP